MNKKKKMTKTLKEVREDLQESVATQSDLQYLRAKTHNNSHFEARRYVAKKILKDTTLAAAYTGLELIHDRYGRLVGNDAVVMRQRLEKYLMSELKRKVKNWDNVYSAL